jgi:hypothetical protein
VRECAQRAAIPVDRIGILASVQPRGFIPPAIAERLGLERAVAVTSYDQIAHVGACGPIFNLDKARAQGRLARGTVIALYLACLTGALPLGLYVWGEAADRFGLQHVTVVAGLLLLVVTVVLIVTGRFRVMAVGDDGGDAAVDEPPV